VAKKTLTWVAIAFAVFYVLSQPSGAADALRSAGGGLREAGDSLALFFEQLFT
jgi:hypothetical protein